MYVHIGPCLFGLQHAGSLKCQSWSDKGFCHHRLHSGTFLVCCYMVKKAWGLTSISTVSYVYSLKLSKCCIVIFFLCGITGKAQRGSQMQMIVTWMSTAEWYEQSVIARNGSFDLITIMISYVFCHSNEIMFIQNNHMPYYNWKCS